MGGEVGVGVLSLPAALTDLLFPVVRQGQVVVASVGLLVVVHERVEVGEVAVQVDVPGVASAHQVAVELGTLLPHKSQSWVLTTQPEEVVVLGFENPNVSGAKLQSLF